MRVLIVDDERPARDKLHRLLSQEADVSAIQQARDAYEALQLIAEFQPDVAFLDIQMPEVSGIELAASLPSPPPLIVFVTAYDQYAIRAFDTNAIDYLLKPFDQARLQRALLRLRMRLQERQPNNSATNTLPATPATAGGSAAGYPVRQLLVTERGVTRVIRTEHLRWIETADNYVVLHCEHEHPLLRQTLSSLLDTLGAQFVRCHRRAAVQLAWIERIISLEKGDAEVVLRGDERVPCSRQFRSELMARIQANPPRPD